MHFQGTLSNMFVNATMLQHFVFQLGKSSSSLSLLCSNQGSDIQQTLLHSITSIVSSLELIWVRHAQENADRRRDEVCQKDRPRHLSFQEGI